MFLLSGSEVRLMHLLGRNVALEQTVKYVHTRTIRTYMHVHTYVAIVTNILWMRQKTGNRMKLDTLQGTCGTLQSVL